VVLSGDATHFKDNWDNKRVSSMNTSADQTLASLKRISDVHGRQEGRALDQPRQTAKPGAEAVTRFLRLSRKGQTHEDQSKRPAVCSSAGCRRVARDRAAAAQTPPAVSAEQIARIVASPDRSAADRTNDLRRKPEQLLVFYGIRPGITALDLSAAAATPRNCWPARSDPRAPSTARAGRAIRTSPRRARRRPRATPTRAPNPAPSAPPAAAAAPPPPSAPRPSPVALAERDAKLKSAGVAAAPITAVSRPFEDPVPPELKAGSVDLVTLIFNYHDLGFLGVDRAKMNEAVFRALKPGGFYIIADHSGRPGTGISESGTLHRIEEAFLRKEVEAAGFKLAEEGNFLRNPNDPRDKNTPDPPQPKDEFVLKFVKP
jgi:predicted methyltransferase